MASQSCLQMLKFDEDMGSSYDLPGKRIISSSFLSPASITPTRTCGLAESLGCSLSILRAKKKHWYLQRGQRQSSVSTPLSNACIRQSFTKIPDSPTNDDIVKRLSRKCRCSFHDRSKVQRKGVSRHLGTYRIAIAAAPLGADRSGSGSVRNFPGDGGAI